MGRFSLPTGQRGRGITASKTVRPSSGDFKESGPKNFYPRRKADTGPKPPKAFKEPARKKGRPYVAVRADGMCRHCTKKKCNRPRGLCWTCYYAPGVTALYPITSKYARKGVGNVTGDRPMPPAPTTAAPGTEEKMQVLEARAEALQSLFHPADARFAGDQLPLEWLLAKVPGFVNEGCAA